MKYIQTLKISSKFHTLRNMVCHQIIQENTLTVITLGQLENHYSNKFLFYNIALTSVELLSSYFIFKEFF